MTSEQTKEKDFYQISLKLILKNSQREILGLKGLDNGSYKGYYDLPGGRIDTDEFETSLPDIIAREIKEELGDITYNLKSKPVAVGRHFIPASMIDIRKDTHVLYLFFEAEYIKGELKISDEHNGYHWLNLKEIELNDYYISGILDGVKMYCDNY